MARATKTASPTPAAAHFKASRSFVPKWKRRPPIPPSRRPPRRRPRPFPPAIQIALRTPIDAENAFGGDAVEGQLEEAVRGPGGAILAGRGALVRGRIVRMERHFAPARYFALGLKFDSMVLNGVEVPLSLDRAPPSAEEQMATTARERSHGIGMFVFHGGPRVLDDNFVSEWKTAARPPVE